MSYDSTPFHSDARARSRIRGTPPKPTVWLWAMAVRSRIASVPKILNVYPDSLRIRVDPLAKRRGPDSTFAMIQPGFLDPESRRDLIELARDGSVPHRLARRANALVLLDQGMSCSDVAKVLFLDDDTIRTWYRLYQEDGFDGLVSFGYDGSACRLSDEQQDQLKAWITETLPRTTGAVGAWVEKQFGISYESRSGLVALLHRLGMEHRKPKAVSSKLDPDKQAIFIQQVPKTC